ncbi:hypothetical protein [Bradyrhizobium sp. 169]|uniref:hypothetical protein n=1 Tax=Bradyrhizobium sp. 169 TaxID=2782640 RepID=UPI001FFA60DE|nr:hypothetical protein [Bradyrhizobium sp. 169]MCK1586912.1 hypothetical protein [Bradyrhizobium sp. 169]
MLALAADERSIAADGSVLIHQAARICTQEQFETLRQLSATEKDNINTSLLELTANFGATSFAHSVPSGLSCWNALNGV